MIYTRIIILCFVKKHKMSFHLCFAGWLSARGKSLIGEVCTYFGIKWSHIPIKVNVFLRKNGHSLDRFDLHLGLLATTHLSRQSRGVPWLATLLVETGCGGNFVPPTPCHPRSLVPTSITIRHSIAHNERGSIRHLTPRRRRRNPAQANAAACSLIPTPVAVLLTIAHNERGPMGHPTRRRLRHRKCQEPRATLVGVASIPYSPLTTTSSSRRCPKSSELNLHHPMKSKTCLIFRQKNMNLLLRTTCKTEVGSVLSLSSSCNKRNRGLYLVRALRRRVGFHSNLVVPTCWMLVCFWSLFI